MAPTVIVVGYLKAMSRALEKFQETGTVVFVEEPDVIRKREVTEQIEGFASIAGLTAFEYQLPGAADTFFHRYRDLDVVAVIPAVEYAVPFVARLAERYGVPGATLGAAELLRDKALLRAVSAEAGVANPASEAVTGPEGIREFVGRHGLPVICKPANRQASVGTTVIRAAEEIDAAWRYAVEQDEGIYVPDREVELRMLVERFVTGPEFSVELIVAAGEVRFANVTGKVLRPGPRPVEVAHTVPADIPAELTARLVAETVRIIDVTGFSSGILHCEWIVEDGVPYLVECAGRAPGDYIMDLITWAWPVDIVRGYVQVMQGTSGVEWPTEARVRGAVHFLDPAETGVVESLAGIEEALAVEHVVSGAYTAKVGDHVHAARSSWDRVGTVIAFAPTVPEALAAARTAISKITVKILSSD